MSRLIAVSLMVLVGCSTTKNGKKADDTGVTSPGLPTGAGTGTGGATGTGTGTGAGTGTGTGSTGTTYVGPITPDVGGPCVGQSLAGTYTGTAQIRCIDVQCTNDDWTWTVLTDGWTRGGTIHIHHESGGEEEEHDIGAIGYAPTGNWWDLLEKELLATNFLHSVSTDADCGNDDATTMTVAMEVWDYTTDTMTNCVVFGADQAFFTGQPQFAGCDLWTW